MSRSTSAPRLFISATLRFTSLTIIETVAPGAPHVRGMFFAAYTFEYSNY
jgi:hypothetical protein